MNALQNLGIDLWSLVLYLVNFGILAVVLTKFLYKPLLRTLDTRRETVKKNLDEAEELRKTLSAEREQRESDARLIAAEATKELAIARADAEARARAVLADAEAKREQMIAEAVADISQRKRVMVAEVEQELLSRVETVAMTVLRDKVPAEVVRDSVKESWQSVSSV
jgi:F-type H+-transporting ATPase subunit b